MTKPCIRTLVALLIVLGLFQACSAAAQTYDLKLRLTEGQTFRLRQTSQQSSSATLDGQTITSNENFSTGLVFTVVRVEPDGTATLRATFDQPSYAVSGSAVEQAGQQIQVLNKAVNGLHNRSFTLTLAPSGAVRSVEGSSDCLRAAVQDLGDVPELVRFAVQALLGPSFDENVIRDGLEGIFHIFPEKPVKIDDRWSKTSSVSTQNTTQNYETFYRILDVTDGTARVKVYRQVKSFVLASALGFKYSLKGSAEGFMYVEESTGLVRSGSLTSNLSGTLYAGDKSAPLKMTGTNRVDRY